jgi:hypothetical protein
MSNAARTAPRLMPEPVQLSPFAQAAPNLEALGFRVLPVVPPSAAHHGGRGKAPGSYFGGSWQGMKKWQQYRDAEPSAFERGMWAKYPDANIGLIMGSPCGQNMHVVALDFDATDADALADLLAAAPHSPMVKVGRKGESRIYRAAKTLKTRSYDGPGGRLVDLLTGFDTRQSVVPPSIHPETGKPYIWTAGPVAADQLPVLTQDDMAVLEETLEGCGWVRSGAAKVGREPRSGPMVIPDEDDFFSETKVAALANLEAWVHDLDVYDLRPARGGYEAVATWRASSTGQPIASRKRNLSIQAVGIKDFGTNWTGSAIDLVMEAQGLSQADATSWLRSRLGLTGEVMVLEQRSKDIAPAPAVTVAPSAPATLRVAASAELPDRLTHVPGLVGTITDWIVETSKRPQRGLSLGAAVTLVGTAAGRKVAGPTDSATHLYVLAIAATGAGKDHPLKCIGRILNASGMAGHLGPSQFMSMSAVNNHLRQQPLTLCAMDEFGAFLKRVNGAKAGNHEQAISGVMRQVWGSSFDQVTTPAYAQSAGTVIVAPAMSLYGASTAEEFYAAVEGGDVLNGFLNRFLTIPTKIRPPQQKPERSVFDIPAEVTDGMVGIYNIGGPLLGATSHNGQSNAPAVVVPWADPQAQRVWDRFVTDIEARGEQDMAFMSRTAEMAVRLATIRAIGVSAFKPAITVDDMEWGRDLALWSAERMMEDAADYMSETPTQAALMKVRRIIRDSAGLGHSALVRKTQFLKNSDLKGHITTLVESGQILVEAVVSEGPGRPGRFYRPL